jgi:hypothetical protein
MWIRAVIIEDEPLAVEYLGALLDDTYQVEVVGAAAMRSQGMHIAKKAAPKRMQSYYEVLFFKSGALHTEYWRVYFELHRKDLAILKEGKSLGLKTQTIVQSSGVLNLLPRDLDNGWNEFGRIVDDGNLESWVCGVEPTFGKNGCRIWVIEGTVKWSRLGLATFTSMT